MEDDEIETSSGSNLVPIALAVLAIVLGGAGLYFGMTANQRINPLSDTMNEGTSSTAAVAKDVAALEKKLAEVSAQYLELKQRVGREATNSKQAMDRAARQLAGGIEKNNADIVNLANRINELATTTVRPSNTGASPASGGSISVQPDDSDNEESAETDGTYEIESGDTFGKIASKLGVGLQDLLDANPEADPRRLRIGQIINVPSH